MNVCQFCGKPATIHLTDIIHKKKKESHLCEECAREKQLIPDVAAPQLNLNALVQLILGDPAQAEPPKVSPALSCPNCGIKYATFRTEGRFGCCHDYDVFEEGLIPLLERVHRATKHTGKAPVGIRGKRELAKLKQELQNAITAERYEDAARLRDEIRRKESTE